ncbi:MAG: dihydroneopterin aldolase [Opitutaceae bacterium]|jgi:dihydroneopterin aldolase|nr:dihydroneopterin aldolase [Opitutaceae bacterium]
MNDSLTLARMRFSACHGVLASEQKRPQPWEVTARLELPPAVAGRGDELAASIDYREIHAAVRAVMEGPPRKLAETLAENIAAELLARFPAAPAVEVEVLKPRPPVDFAFDGFLVRVRRERK